MPRSVVFKVKDGLPGIPHIGIEGGSCPIDKVAEIVLTSTVNAIDSITVGWVDFNGVSRASTYLLTECPYCGYDGETITTHNQHAHDDAYVAHRERG